MVRTLSALQQRGWRAPQIDFEIRWRAIGGQVLIDPAINLSHHGAAAYEEPLLKYLQMN